MLAAALFDLPIGHRIRGRALRRGQRPLALATFTPRPPMLTATPFRITHFSATKRTFPCSSYDCHHSSARPRRLCIRDPLCPTGPFKTAMRRRRETLGGTCPERPGCIPFQQRCCMPKKPIFAARSDTTFATWASGQKARRSTGRRADLQGRTRFRHQHQGIEFLFKKKQDRMESKGLRPPSPEGRQGSKSDWTRVTQAQKTFIIATGSEPAFLPGVEVDETVVVTPPGAAVA